MARLSVKPISPSEVAALRTQKIPDFVIKSFNELIAEHSHGRRTCRIQQGEIIERILESAASARVELSRGDIFVKHYLDVEDIYSKAGWDVKYDKSGYNEEYEPFFVFTAKK